MRKSRDESEFWDRVEHDMKMQQPGLWRTTLLMLRMGMVVVLFAATYVGLFTILKPPSGFFVSRHEMAVSPVFWMLAGTGLIIGGAYLRFRAIGPIADKLKAHGLD